MKLIKKFQDLIKLYRYWKQHPLASRDMGGTITRFLQWQIGYRILYTPIVWPWLNKSCLVIEPSMTGATMNIYCGLHEFSDMAFLLHFLKPEDCFVDIGANVGSYTVLASSVIGATSLAIEPIPLTHSKLLRNIAVNRIQEKVEAKCCGVGKENDGFLSFIADQDTMNKVAPSSYTGATISVPIHTLDTLLASFDAALWKIDVEGYEQEVLEGAQKVLMSPKLLAIEMEGDSPEIRRLISSKGFQPYTYDAFKRVLTPESGTKSSHNWLWIRDFDTVAQRCKDAAPISVFGITI